MRRIQLLVVLILASGLLPAQEGPPVIRHRRPVALCLDGTGPRALVACRRSGSLVLLDVEKECVICEADVGISLTDVVRDGPGSFLVIDEGASQLVRVKLAQNRIKVSKRFDLPVGGSSVVADGEGAWVGSPWAVNLSSVWWPGGSVQTGIRLPFRVGRLLKAPPSHRSRGPWLRWPAELIAADAFGGRLAVLEGGICLVTKVRDLGIHNIRALALSGDRVFLAHQQLNPFGRTTADDVRWGLVLTNQVTELSLASLMRMTATGLEGAVVHQLGEDGSGSGDPSGLAVTDGTIYVTLGGTSELLAIDRGTGERTRVVVGNGGAASPALISGGKRVLIAEPWTDSVAIVDLESDEPSVRRLSLGPSPVWSAVDRGERSFHDANLSRDGWMSCASCHPRGHTVGRLADTLSDGDYGAPKLIPSLRGIEGTAPFGWTGSFARLEDQIRRSVETTLHGSVSDEHVADLAAFVESLTPVAPVPDRLDPGGLYAAEAVPRGKRLFKELDCVSCHVPPRFTSDAHVDVGSRDRRGRKHFNPPSLRGAVHREAFFHDGRARTLEDVLTSGHPGPDRRRLSGDEMADLIYYLRSL